MIWKDDVGTTILISLFKFLIEFKIKFNVKVLFFIIPKLPKSLAINIFLIFFKFNFLKMLIRSDS